MHLVGKDGTEQSGGLKGLGNEWMMGQKAVVHVVAEVVEVTVMKFVVDECYQTCHGLVFHWPRENTSGES